MEWQKCALAAIIPIRIALLWMLFSFFFSFIVIEHNKHVRIEYSKYQSLFVYYIFYHFGSEQMLKNKNVTYKQINVSFLNLVSTKIDMASFNHSVAHTDILIK